MQPSTEFKMISLNFVLLTSCGSKLEALSYMYICMRVQLRYTSIQKEDQSSMKQVTCPTKPITGVAGLNAPPFWTHLTLTAPCFLTSTPIDIWQSPGNFDTSCTIFLWTRQEADTPLFSFLIAGQEKKRLKKPLGFFSALKFYDSKNALTNQWWRGLESTSLDFLPHILLGHHLFPALWVKDLEHQASLHTSNKSAPGWLGASQWLCSKKRLSFSTSISQHEAPTAIIPPGTRRLIHS